MNSFKGTRTNSKRVGAIAVAFVTVGMVLSGCASSEPSNSSNGEPAEATQQPAGDDSAEKDSDLTGTALSIAKDKELLESVDKNQEIADVLPAKYHEAGKIVVGASGQGAPSFYIQEDGKTQAGYELDLSRAMAKLFDVDLEYKDMKFDQLINSVRSGRIDYAMGMMSDTEEREQTLDFVDYAVGGISFLVQKGNPAGITGANDTFCGKTAAASPGAMHGPWAEQFSKDYCEAEGLEPITVVEAGDSTQQFNSLRTGRVDTKLADLANNVYTAQTYKDGSIFEVVDTPPLEGGHYGMGVNKDNPELRDALKAAMQELVDDGIYQKILDNWELGQSAVDTVLINTPEVQSD